jgi:hypothetical protein
MVEFTWKDKPMGFGCDDDFAWYKYEFKGKEYGRRVKRIQDPDVLPKDYLFLLRPLARWHIEDMQAEQDQRDKEGLHG